MAHKQFGKAALEALAFNDVEKLLAAFGKGANVNAQVIDGAYGGTDDFIGMQHAEGDTLLHMALKNKKWAIKTALVVQLEADGTVCNAEGVSPPGMELATSGKRMGASILCFAYVHFQVFGLDFGDMGYLAALGFLLASLVAHLLAWRWYGLSRIYKTAKVKGLPGFKQGRAKGLSLIHI